MENALVVHGGAPTAVINTSLYGVIAGLRQQGFGGGVLGARFGSQGLLSEDFIDLGALPAAQLDALRHTPGSAIGTSRTQLEDAEYERIAQVLKEHHIRYVLYTGGNGSMDAAGKLWQRVQAQGITVVGVPKTIDNDLMVTDHAPGYASCANYLASTVQELAQDVQSLPIHIVVLEVMGRNTGWLAAATALARGGKTLAPHLICFPEVPFDEADFLARVQELHRRYGGAVVVASEGLKQADGTHVVPPIFRIGEAVYFGDVSSHLANVIIKNLGIKARGEKPGILNRCAAALVSQVDVQEAEAIGREAARLALAGQGGVMVGLRRVSSTPYAAELIHIPLAEVMKKERLFPREFMSADGHDVTPAFLDWARPLVNPPADFVSLV